MINKKIKGAQEIQEGDNKFRSKSELRAYKKLKEANLNFEYEPEKVLLWQGIKLNNTKIYAPKKKRRGVYEKDLSDQTRSLVSMTYTPDFKIYKKTKKNNYIIYLEVKGMESDTYPIKKKIFLKSLEERKDDISYLFFETHSTDQVSQAIDIINKLP